jgi:hypothetical protein
LQCDSFATTGTTKLRREDFDTLRGRSRLRDDRLRLTLRL